MPPDLQTCAPATRRRVLVAYAAHHPPSAQAVAQRLSKQAWAPTPEDCPVDWAVLDAWYQGLQRTGQLGMNSY